MVYKFGNKNTRGRDGKQKITEQGPKIMKTLDSQIKTHGSVSCSPRKRDARKRSGQEQQSLNFHAPVAL